MLAAEEVPLDKKSSKKVPANGETIQIEEDHARQKGKQIQDTRQRESALQTKSAWEPGGIPRSLYPHAGAQSVTC